MPNIVPSDVHTNVPVGTEKDSRAAASDNEWAVRRKQAKKKQKKNIQYSPDWVQKKFHSAENRKELAERGDALPDKSYPIEDPEDLGNAATLARSGHGDVTAAKRLIARRAKEMGVKNPLLKQGDSVKKSSAGFELATSCFSRLTE